MSRKIVVLFCLLFSLALTVVAANKKFVLVIDAGHGGRDHGTVYPHHKWGGTPRHFEKELTLRYALAFGKLVERNCPDVKVIYTRTKDVYPDLQKRSDIANKNKADLFVSIHVNSVDARNTALNGFVAYTLGKGTSDAFQKNLEVTRDHADEYEEFENMPELDIMAQLEQEQNQGRSIYAANMIAKSVGKRTALVSQGVKQKNLSVLRLTVAPAVLLETGYLNNDHDRALLISSDMPEKFAQAFYEGFLEYKKKYQPYGPNSAVAEPPAEEMAKDKSAGKKKKKVEQEPEPQEAQPKDEKAPDHDVAEQNPVEEKKKDAEQVAPVADKNYDAPVFKVQIMACNTKLKPDDKRFKGVKNAEGRLEGKVWKYTVGSSDDYNEINRLRKSLAVKFPEAFVIAFRNGERMNVNEAIEEFLKNKQQKQQKSAQPNARKAQTKRKTKNTKKRR